MKKIILIIVLVVAAISANAQQTTNYPVVRNGNTYLTDEGAMNKRAFLGYLQSRDAIAYNSFRSGYNLSQVGWGLFGAGLGMEVISIPMLIVGLGEGSTTYVSKNKDVVAVATSLTSLTLGAYTMMYVGGAMATSGAICLIVGYVRMHNAADTYSFTHARQQQPAVALGLQASRDGIGLAIRF